MLNDRMALLDVEGLAIVVVGTMIAVLLGFGCANARIAVAMAIGLLRASIDENANRAALARTLHAIKRDGRHAVDAPLPGDAVLAALVAAYLRLGEVEDMRAAWRADRAIRLRRRSAGVAVWRHAADLAPVFGLVGTLYAITGLAPSGGDDGLAVTTATAIGTAVASSLYGLLLAQLVCLPVAGVITRRAVREDAVRKRLIAWFESQLPHARPGSTRPESSVLREVA